jgi:hypothetical protein
MRLMNPLRSALMTCAFILTLVTFSWAEEPKEDGFEAIFNGKDLAGWKGNLEYWSVEDGAITGTNTADKPTPHNTFIVWDKEVGDFELRLQYKIVGGNSGIQYRSKLADAEKFIVGGYQADIDSSPTYSGINYEERGRGILAERGQAVKITGEKTIEVVKSLGDKGDLQKKINAEQWNDYVVIAKGGVLQHIINGVPMSTVEDVSSKAQAKGILALQLHAGPPMKVQFKNVRIKQL